MSETPSPLKSPTPATFQACEGTVLTACGVAELAERQITFLPSLLLRQRTSDRPSPLKSPMPATFHVCCGTVLTTCGVAELAESQTAFLPSTPLRQRMSDRASPLKSRSGAPRGTLAARNAATMAMVCARARALSARSATPQGWPPQTVIAGLEKTRYPLCPGRRKDMMV